MKKCSYGACFAVFRVAIADECLNSRFRYVFSYRMFDMDLVISAIPTRKSILLRSDDRVALIAVLPRMWRQVSFTSFRQTFHTADCRVWT